MKKITKYSIVGSTSMLILTSLSPTLTKVISLFENKGPESLYSGLLSLSKFAPASTVIAAFLLMLLIMARHSLMPEIGFFKKLYVLKIELLLLLLMSNCYWFAQPTLQSEKLSNTASEDKLTGLNVNIESLKAVQQLVKRVNTDGVDFIFITSKPELNATLNAELSSIGFSHAIAAKNSSTYIYSRYVLSSIDVNSSEEPMGTLEKDNRLYLLIAIDNRDLNPIQAKLKIEKILKLTGTKTYPTIVGGHLNLAPTDPVFEKLNHEFDISKISYPLVSGNPWLRGVFGESAAPILGSNTLKFISHESSNVSGQKYRGELFILNTN